MKLKVYISCNTLVNTERSLSYLYHNIYNSKLRDTPVVLIHDSLFNFFYLNKYNLNIEYIKGIDNGFEYPALHKLWQDSQESSFYGLYIHCKGSSKSDEAMFNRDLRWVDCMFHGLLDHSDTCLDYLGKGADLVGCMWYRHFKGNFFWFKSDYIKFMPNPIEWLYLKTAEGNNWYSRYDAEYWCCYAYWYGLFSPIPYPRVKNLFYLNRDFSDYVNKELLPKVPEKYTCTNLRHNIENNCYDIYNELHLTNEEYENYKDILFKFVDFDNKVYLPDGKVFSL